MFCLGWCGAGRTAANPLSLFNGSCRPRRILPNDKMLRGVVVFGVAVCFAAKRYGADGRRSLVQCLGVVPSAPVCLTANRLGGRADGGCGHVHCLMGRTVRNAFCLRQNATVVGMFGAAVCFAAKHYEDRYVWRGGLLCGKMLRWLAGLARRGVLLRAVIK